MKPRKDGRYTIRVTLEDGSKKDVFAYSPAEVKAKAIEILKLSEQGIVINDNTTLDNWHSKWFSTYKNNLTHSGKMGYDNAYTHIKPLLGSIPLKKIKPINIQMVMNTVACKGESLQNKVLQTMRQMFETAIQNNLILKSPCVGVKIVKKLTETKIKTLNEVQQLKLLEAVKGTRAYLFVAIGLYAGLRREETLALMWDDINLKTNRIKINRSLTFINNRPNITPNLKSKSAFREIPIQPPLFDILKDAEHKALYVVIDTHDNPMSETAYRKMWGLTDKANFDCTSHMLRHTYCTQLHKMGIDLKTAQYLMGHSDIKMTAKIYTHIENMQIQSADDKIKLFYINQLKKSLTKEI